MPNIIKKYKYELILGIAIVLYIILFSYLSIRRYLALNSHYFDLGIMNQVVYNTYRGNFLEMTNQDFLRNISRLAIHFDPILAFFAPFYFIYAGPEVLLVGQTIILALGAAAVFMITNHALKNKRYGLLLSMSYLLFFPVERANTFDFHSVTLATTFLLWMFYFMLVKKYKTALTLMLLAFLTKEHVGLVTFMFGAYLFFFKKEKRFGALISILSLTFFLTTVFLVIPYFRQADHFAIRQYGDFGDSPAKAILGVIIHPKVTLRYILRDSTFLYLFRVFFPHAVFTIFAPLYLLIALPEIMINVFSANGNMRDIYFHYNSLIVPFVMISSIYGLKKITEIKRFKGFVNIFIVVFIITNLISIYLYNPLPLSFLKQPYWWGRINDGKLKVIKTWQSTLKDDDISVSTTPKLAPFFSSRRYYYNFLFDPSFSTIGLIEDDIIKTAKDYRHAEFVIINLDEVKPERLENKFYEILANDDNFVKIFSDRSGIEVFKKVIN